MAPKTNWLEQQQAGGDKNVGLQLTPEEVRLIESRRAVAAANDAEATERAKRSQLADRFLEKPVGTATPEETAAATSEVLEFLRSLNR